LTPLTGINVSIFGFCRENGEEVIGEEVIGEEEKNEL
jgi:hypothetical protein